MSPRGVRLLPVPGFLDGLAEYDKSSLCDLSASSWILHDPVEIAIVSRYGCCCLSAGSRVTVSPCLVGREVFSVYFGVVCCSDLRPSRMALLTVACQSIFFGGLWLVWLSLFLPEERSCLISPQTKNESKTITMRLGRSALVQPPYFALWTFATNSVVFVGCESQLWLVHLGALL